MLKKENSYNCNNIDYNKRLLSNDRFHLINNNISLTDVENQLYLINKVNNYED